MSEQQQSTENNKSKKLYLPRFCIVPLQARLDKSLNDAAKIYLGELNALSNKFGYCYASDEQLAEMKQVSVRTIERWNKDLQERGFLIRDTTHTHVKTEKGVEVRKSRKMYVIENPSNKVAEPPDLSVRSVPPNLSVRSVPTKMAVINKEPLNQEHNNNRPPPPDDQEHPPSKPKSMPPAAAAQAVVVFSCFDELDVSQAVKIRLSKEMDEEKAKLLVKRVLAWETRESDLKACNTILDPQKWDTWSDVVDKKENTEENRKWAKENLHRFDQKRVGAYTCWILSSGVEFVTSGAMSKVVCFEYESQFFQTEIKEFIKNNAAKKQ